VYVYICIVLKVTGSHFRIERKRQCWRKKLIVSKENRNKNRIIYVAVNPGSSGQGTVTTTAATATTTSTLNEGEYMTFFPHL